MWILLAAACTGAFDDPGCLHRELDDWCRHDPSADGPVGEGECPEPEATPMYRCGDYDVDLWGGLSSETHYFDHESGELVAVRYTKDTNTYCGGFSYWYGERVKCELECSYLDEDDDLACE